MNSDNDHLGLLTILANLPELKDEYDRLVDKMQTPEHRAAVDALFAMDGKTLGHLAALSAHEVVAEAEQVRLTTAGYQDVPDAMIEHIRKSVSQDTTGGKSLL